MKKLTKKLRHKIYKEALKVYLDHRTDGICTAILIGMNNLNIDTGLVCKDFMFQVENFEEIFSRKPI